MADTTFEDGTGSIDSSWLNDVNDWTYGILNVSHYGATGDGITDDTDAIQATIDAANTAGGGVVYIPSGTYLVSTTMSATLTGDKSVKFKGDGIGITIFRFNTAGNGLNITLSGSWWLQNTAEGSTGLSFEDISFSTTNANTGIGLNIVGSSVAGRPNAPIYFTRCEFRAESGFVQYWQYAVKLLDTGDAWFNSCRFIQGGSTNLTAKGLFLTGTASGNSPTSYYLNNCQSFYGAIGLELGDYIEGVYITNSNFVGSTTAIQWYPAAAESGLHIVGGHYSSKLYDIDLDNVFDFNITGALLYRQGTTEADSKSIRLQTVGRYGITGNTFKGEATADGEVAIHVLSSVNDEKYGGSISGNTFHSYYGNAAVWLGAAANYVHIGDNLYRDCTVRTLNQSANNNCTIHKKQYVDTVTKTLTGGAANEDITITIPTGMLLAKANSVIVTGISDTQIVGFYDYTNSTSTSAIVKLRKIDGTNLTAGSTRFSFLIAE